MRKQLQELAALTKPLIESSNDPFIRLEALKLLACLNGVPVAQESRVMDAKAASAMRYAREAVLGRVWQRASARKRANRKFYLQTRIRELERDSSDPIKLEQFKAELKAMKDAPRMPNAAAESPQDASTATGIGMDPSFDLEAAKAQARAYMLERKALMEKE